MRDLEVNEFKKLSLRLEVKDNTSANDFSGESIVANFSNFSNFFNFSKFSNFLK